LRVTNEHIPLHLSLPQADLLELSPLVVWQSLAAVAAVLVRTAD